MASSDRGANNIKLYFCLGGIYFCTHCLRFSKGIVAHISNMGVNKWFLGDYNLGVVGFCEGGIDE